MTAAAPLTGKQKQRLRPEYRALEARRRKLPRNRSLEAAATRRRKSTPEGWAKARIPGLKHKARKCGLEFAIDWRDIIPSKLCPVFGCEFAFGAPGYFVAHPTAPSVDRIDNNLGYIKGNVRVISVRANLLKKDGTLAEFKQLVAWLERESVSLRP